jgi:hypothetical protein
MLPYIPICSNLVRVEENFRDLLAIETYQRPTRADFSDPALWDRLAWGELNERMTKLNAPHLNDDYEADSVTRQLMSRFPVQYYMHRRNYYGSESFRFVRGVVVPFPDFIDEHFENVTPQSSWVFATTLDQPHTSFLPTRGPIRFEPRDTPEAPFDEKNLSTAEIPRDLVTLPAILFMNGPAKETTKLHRKVKNWFMDILPFVQKGEYQLVNDEKFFEGLEFENAAKRAYFLGLTRYQRERANGYVRYAGRNFAVVGTNYSQARFV